MPLHRLAVPMLTACLAVAGCAGGPPPPKPWAETATRELNLSIAHAEVQGRRVTVTRSARAGGPLPVVVYLPGLGQDGDAGQRWVTAWAQAGYAVLGLQPLEDDAAAWRSPLARTGEFRELGELHFGEAMRTRRQAALRRLLTALQAQPAWAGVTLDWQRAAVAGYETGAQAALDLGLDATAWQPRAVITISPPPMDAPAAAPPLLLVTSDNDGDALGLITRPAERRRIFETQRPGAAWLLQLPTPSHAALSGTLAPEGWHAQDQHRGGEGMAGRGARGGGMGDGPRGPQGPMGGPARGPRSGSATEAAQADLADAMRLSTAFLDAQLRGAAMPADTALRAR
jgi:dienelactone hydrolase